MPFILNPERQAILILEQYGIRIENLYAESTGDINKKEIRKLNLINPVLLHNARMTIERLDKSDNAKNLDFQRNVRNTIVGTLQAVVMETMLEKEDPKNPTLVKIIPSKAKEPDAYHARFYGKVMSLQAALKIGITVRYGCQCGIQILTNEQKNKEALKI